MRRRKFLASTAVGVSGLSAQRSGASADESGASKLRLPGDYYRHYPVDFSRRQEGALGFKGWGDSEDIEAPVSETAIISMHVWNIGFHPELPFSHDGPAGGVMDMLEWAGRSENIIRNTLPPIFSAARKAGIRVIHVASDERYAVKYSGYEKTRSLAGPEPAGLPKAPRHDQQKPPDNRKSGLLFGPGYTRDIDFYAERIDFPEPAKPSGDEYIAVTTHQFNEVLRHHGIWNLIYVGFAINWCLWFSPCGMTDMSRLGYRCSCIREGVTAVENKESVRGEFNKQQALWRTSLMFGYIHSARDFITACEQSARG